MIFDSNEPKHFSPIQSDTEFEVSRLKGCDECTISSSDDANKQLAHRPSWRWGELPSPIPKSELQDLQGAKEPAKDRDRKFDLLLIFCTFFMYWSVNTFENLGNF